MSNALSRKSKPARFPPSETFEERVRAAHLLSAGDAVPSASSHHDLQVRRRVWSSWDETAASGLRLSAEPSL